MCHQGRLMIRAGHCLWPLSAVTVAAASMLFACGSSTNADDASVSGTPGSSSQASGATSSTSGGSGGQGASGSATTATTNTASSSSVGGSGGAGGPSILRVIAIGDTGEGNPAQHCVGDAMDAKCGLEGGCDAVMLNGDNFYDHGVQSVADPQWGTSFELPYDRPHLNGLKFYAVLGNHDYGLTSSGDKKSQIDYSYLPVGNGPNQRPSDKWTMPAAYYDVKLGGDLLHLFAVDSQDTGQGQLSDMQQRVANSTASWKITFAHHPRFTSGDHQADNALLDGLTKFAQPPGMFALLEGIYCDTDMLMTGHDHNRELIDKGTDSNCPNTYFAISGAGAKTRSSDFSKVAGSLYYDETVEGFAYMEFTSTSFLFEFYDVPPGDCVGAASKAPAFAKVITK